MNTVTRSRWRSEKRHYPQPQHCYIEFKGDGPGPAFRFRGTFPTEEAFTSWADTVEALLKDCDLFCEGLILLQAGDLVRREASDSP